MFNETVYSDGLGESKESILARGCTKASKGVFRCPDGSTVTPDSGYYSAAPGGDITRSVPTSSPNRCPSGQSWVGPPINQCMSAGSPSTTGSAGAGTPIDMGGTTGVAVAQKEKAAESGEPGFLDSASGFLSGSVAGIPIWMIAGGLVLVMVLKKR